MPFDCLQDLDNIYKSIKEDCFNNEEKKVYIFVSALEVDSVCALRILQVKTHNAAQSSP